MKRIKDFSEWISEEFATVGVAPEGNVQGMGNPVAPTSTSVGSGDAWPSLLPTLKKKIKFKSKKKLKHIKKKEDVLMKNPLQENVTTFDKRAFIEDFIQQVKTFDFSDTKYPHLTEYQGWWSVDKDLQYDKSIPFMDKLRWEKKQRELPEKDRYRGEIYNFEMKIGIRTASHIYRYSSIDVETCTLMLDEDMKEIADILEKLFYDTMKKHGIHYGRTANKMRI